MNKVKIFEGKSRLEIENEINNFARTHEIINASIAEMKWGYSGYYTVIVVYEA